VGHAGQRATAREVGHVFPARTTVGGHLELAGVEGQEQAHVQGAAEVQDEGREAVCEEPKQMPAGYLWGTGPLIPYLVLGWNRLVVLILGNEAGRQRAPLTGALYCTSTRRVSSRYAGGTGTRKPNNRELERSAYAPRLRTYTQPAQLVPAGAQLPAHTQPALRTGLMAPAWRLLHVSRRVILDFFFWFLRAFTIVLSLAVLFKVDVESDRLLECAS